MWIDCHTHAFSEKIAERAIQQLISYYRVQTSLDGTLTELIEMATEVKLDAAIVLVAATKGEQVRPAHEWILRSVQKHNTPTHTPRLIPFGTYHPDNPNWLHEIKRLRAAGIKGIKLHPEFQGIDLADPRLLPFFEEVRDFILLVHVGDPRVSPNNMSTPTKVANIARLFPQLRIIVAHMGGYCMWEEAMETLVGTDVYLDTSSTIGYASQDLFKRMIQKHDIHRILFGSDYPLRAPIEDYRAIDQMTWLTSSDKQLIFGENCRQLLGI